MKQLDHEETSKNIPNHQITILCDDVTLPSNIGAIFRLADAFGAEQIIFGGSDIDTQSRKVKQVSRSTHQWLRHTKSNNLLKEISKLRTENYRIIALELTDQSIPINDLELNKNQKIALIIGSEIKGISSEVLNAADLSCHIPLFGKNSSMNVNNALGIMLYEISKQINN